MNPLLKRLASLRRKVRLLDGWQGVCALLSLVLGLGVTAGVIDFWIHLPNLVRALALVGLLVGAGAVAYRYIYLPFSRPCDDLSLALRVEDVYPELNDALASTVQFLKQTPDDQARIGGSATMRERTVQETLAKVDAFDFGRVIDRKAAVLFSVSAFCVLLVAGAVIGMHRQYALTAFLRLVEPFGMHTWTRIEVARQTAPDLIEQQAEEDRWKPIETDKKDRVAVGRPYFIKVNLQGQIPADAKVEIQGQIRTDKTIKLQVDPKDRWSASFVTAIDMTQQYQKFKFRILANDGAFPARSGSWHEVEVLPPPKLVDLDGKPSPQILLYPPEYTDKPSPARLEPGTRSIDLFAGTNVILRAKADRLLDQAWVEYRPENTLVTPAAILSFLGETSPLHAAGKVAGGHAVWGRFPAAFEGDGATFRIAFMPWVTGGYVLHLRDHDRLDRHEASDLRVQRDPEPDVKLLYPGSAITALPDAKIAFKFRVTDEFFAVRSVFVEYRKKAPNGGWIGETQRVVLHDATEYGKQIPVWLSALKLPTVQAPRVRSKRLDFQMVWSLQNQFKEGDIVIVEVCADDFCDLYSGREPGRSHAIELRIVGRGQILAEGDAKLKEVQQQLVRLEKMQQEARKTVDDTKKLDKFDAQARERLIEAEQTQREIDNIVGKTAEQGLRNDLRELRNLLERNKLDNTDLFKKAGVVQGALDQIAQQDLPQIEPKLAEARNDVMQTDKNTPQIKKKLEEPGKLQENVEQAFKELNKELAPFASMQQHKGELRDLIAKQKQLQRDLEELKTQKNELENANPDFKQEIDKDFRDKIQAKVQNQNELAQQTEELLKKMKGAQEQREKTGDKANAERLKQAIEQAEQPKQPKVGEQPKQPDNKGPITKQMKDVAQELKGKSEAPEQALEKQNAIVDDLDKVLGKLEGRNQDAAQLDKQEIKNREEVAKKVDEMNKRLERLQEETKKAAKIEDMVERLKKQEELAQKHAQLREEMKKTARELARLQEQRAANDVNEAAKQLEKAENDLKNGGDAREPQKQAEKDLNQAKAELEKRQEELARELLIKIADKLEGLKKRQDSSLQRSEDLHAKIMKRKTWSDPLLDTMEGNIDGQKGIADEADTLKEQIKEAKVFHSILERAKESMDKAGEVMKTRRDEGKDRRYVDDEKMNAKELKDETEWHTDTVKQQKQAAQRLDRLLDALKEELAKKPKQQKPRDVAKEGDPKEPKEKEPQGGMRPADGIPPMAQLKALRAEQLDLNELTENFGKRHEDAKNLTEEQRRELRELEVYQERLSSLFQELTAQPPQQKEGEPQ